MGKDFLKLKAKKNGTSVLVLAAGLLAAGILGMSAYENAELLNGNELQRNDAGNGSYEQEVLAHIGEEALPVTVWVDERVLSEAEAKKELEKAEKSLGDLLKGENESLEEITGALCYVDLVPQTAVEVEWTSKPEDYFYSDGALREELELSEPVELKVEALLYCQGYTKDYEVNIILLPREITVQQKLERMIVQKNEASKEEYTLALPESYEGSPITWKKPVDRTFLYVLVLTVAAMLFLKIGAKRDEQAIVQKRLEEFEKDYAQIVSKFTMLLSAGLSVRNAWERILLLYRGKMQENRPIVQEMNWAYRQMQKGIPELKIYEEFGMRVGLIHYKKLMALFISDQRRGSINLLEAMNQEMLQAWEEKKRKTRQQGEKVAAKLLVPMMGMLAVVFIIILVPAFLSFQL